MRPVLLAALTLTLWPLGQARAKEQRLGCESSGSFPSGGSRSVELKLDVDGERVRLVGLFACTSTGRVGGGSCCALEFDEKSEEVTWVQEQKGRLTTVTGKVKGPPERTDRLVVEQKGKEYEVRLLDVGHGWCGFTSEFPKVVTLHRGKAACRVKEK